MGTCKYLNVDCKAFNCIKAQTCYSVCSDLSVISTEGVCTQAATIRVYIHSPYTRHAPICAGAVALQLCSWVYEKHALDQQIC